MKRLPMAMIVAASVVLAPSPANAHRGPTSFDGTCTLSGTVRHDPPLGVLPVEGSAVATARGTCSGTLTNANGSTHRLDRARVLYRATASGSLSCGGGSSTGRGYLEIAQHRIGLAFGEYAGRAWQCSRFSVGSAGPRPGSPPSARTPTP